MNDRHKFSPPETLSSQSSRRRLAEIDDCLNQQPLPIHRFGRNSGAGLRPVVAAFDPDHNVIWVNDEFQNRVARSIRTNKKLRDEDIETLVHEFGRVLDYADIFEGNSTRSDQMAAIRVRRSRELARSTVESFTNLSLLRERRAEDLAQRVRMEIISSFDRGQHGVGLKMNSIIDQSEQSSAEWMRQLRQEYVRKAHSEFLRLSASRDQYADNDDIVDVVIDNPRFQIIEMHAIASLFPTNLSTTLETIVRQMTEFGIIFAAVRRRH